MGHGLVQVWAQAGPQVESVVCRRWWGGGGMAEQTALFPGEAGGGGMHARRPGFSLLDGVPARPHQV